MLLNFSIQLARNGAWKFAGEYHSAADKKLAIRDRDKNISSLAGKLINPGRFLSAIIKIVGFAEWKSVSRTMDQLDVLTKKV
jgi:hypothetical protein